MKIQKPAVAGTLESSDAQVTVEPGEGSLELDLSSSVMNQYGRQIKATVLETPVSYTHLDDELQKSDHNFVQADAAEAAKQGTLAELVDAYFGE